MYAGYFRVLFLTSEVQPTEGVPRLLRLLLYVIEDLADQSRPTIRVCRMVEATDTEDLPDSGIAIQDIWIDSVCFVVVVG